MRRFYDLVTPGTFDRGRVERARIDSMIAAAGGIVPYMRGRVWHTTKNQG